MLLMQSATTRAQSRSAMAKELIFWDREILLASDNNRTCWGLLQPTMGLFLI